ncbi:MAG: glutaredoxin family protein [Planctomycetaceae bacterium]|nr:glutaredoxin family protein [Planctomycetaceae bacterium]MCA9065810.1 glutaredoxin family protein [Planctomycetaceae bacterium]
MEESQDPLHRFTGWMGTFLLAAASLLAVLIFADRTGMQLFSMPDVWVATRQLHVFTCAVLLLMAGILLMHRPGDGRQRHRPLFHSVRLYTRPDCGLCDEAYQVLSEFREVFPGIEVVDISEDVDLEFEFGEEIPVVEIDDVVRFRGRVERGLLLRIIDAAREQTRSRHDVSVEDGDEDEDVPVF